MSKIGAGVLAVLALALVAAANAEVFFQEDFTGRLCAVYATFLWRYELVRCLRPRETWPRSGRQGVWVS